MKPFLPILLCAATAACAAPAWAQDRIYRCGNEYTNNASQAQQRGCKLVEGGNVTVIQGVRPTAAPSSSAPVVTAPGSAPRVDADAQRARDADARAILESELRKAEERQAALQKEYNNGEPERQGNERNYQKYLDRVAELKASIARNESDIAGIKRELSRLSAAK
ncbi:hypothetical protein PY257_09400 [Ramlibacter sp. H39-3-26]|uniref:hypothetical protein n=1 Tax=Curvibacter soli TaxID=3031331 RepID=UPI0023DA44A7|nr:hypothetical protein [Ramlibacter sp. H39-3-26]MDF1485390.1 hypothetical protein [Ramlibacter sp. H39-3-26]